MEKLEKFVLDYDPTAFNTLPKFLRRRVDALKKLQLEHIKVQTQYHKELQELEMKYEKLYQPLYEKRQKIINGEHEPTEEESTLPPNLVEKDFNGDQENTEEPDKPILSAEEETALESKVKGVPGFWLGTLLSSYNFAESIEPYDRPVLKHLKDVQLSYEDREEHLVYKLDFQFEDNPYFTNKVLSKTYYLSKAPDAKNPFQFEGYEVCKSEGCEINWNPGKNVMLKTVPVKQKNKNDGRTRVKKKEIERDSFFYFFKPPEMSEPTSDGQDSEADGVMIIDFELGEIFRQYLIPKAVLYYSGLMNEDDDDEDDDDDLDGYPEMDDSDSDLDDSDASDESDDSDDSLEASKDKKKLLNNNKSKSPGKSP